MLPSRPHHARNPLHPPSSLARSGSCPAKPKPSVQMHEVQTPVIVEGSNVWAAKRSGSEFQARLGVWAMKRQWSEATLTKPSPVLALREELVSPFQKSQPHKRGSCGTSAIWHIGSRKACIQGWEPLSPQREQKEQVLAAPLHRLPAAQAAHGSPSPVKSPRLTAPPLLPPQSSPPREDAVPRARVAIVGAGPVGLWVAVLLARAHARLFFTASGFRIKRLPGAPDINVFERRTDEGGWGSRRIVLAMSNASQDVLNSRLMSERELCAHHCFSPTCSINLIESILREEFEKYAASGFGTLHLGHSVEDPEALLADHDVVIVATGRSWPGEEWRRGRDFQLTVGEQDEALILKFVLQPATDLAKTLQEVRSAVGRFEAPDLPMYILRPGTSEEQGWLWVLGLSPHILRHLRGILLQASQEDATASGATQGLKLGSFLQVLTCMPRRKSKLLTALRAAFTYLDKQLRPCEVAPRLTLASYWNSNEVVRRTQCGSRSGWIVLVGDAACGKPFYFGSNLNGHFQDAMALLSVPWSQLPSQGEPGAQARAEEEPFKRYAAEYRRRIAESRGFHTSKTSASAKITL